MQGLIEEMEREASDLLGNPEQVHRPRLGMGVIGGSRLQQST
jgi:hypothetical protein